MGRDKYPTGGMEAEKLSGIKVKKTDTETELELEKKKNLTGLQKINNVNFSGSKWKRAGKKKKKLRGDRSETKKGQLRAEPKWRRGGTRRDETAEQENNSKPYDNCERDPLITCHL